MDARVPMAPIVNAFGLAITVTRPSPDDTPVITTGVWKPQPLDEQRPYGVDFQKAEPRKVMSIPRSATLPTIPRGTRILAPEYLGWPVKTWATDGLEGPTEVDVMRVRLTQVADV